MLLSADSLLSLFQRDRRAAKKKKDGERALHLDTEQDLHTQPKPQPR